MKFVSLIAGSVALSLPLFIFQVDCDSLGLNAVFETCTDWICHPGWCSVSATPGLLHIESLCAQNRETLANPTGLFSVWETCSYRLFLLVFHLLHFFMSLRSSCISCFSFVWEWVVPTSLLCLSVYSPLFLCLFTFCICLTLLFSSLLLECVSNLCNVSVTHLHLLIFWLIC